MMKDPSKETYWRLLAIHLETETAGPELYGLIHEGETDVPLMAGDRIVFFTERRHALDLIQQYGSSLQADQIDVAEPFFRCDVAQALYFLSAGGYDHAAAVLNAVNVLLDLVKASGITMIDERRRALYSIADYCTTSKDITKYLEEEGDFSSRQLVDAVLWCVGAVAVKARVVA
jgi:hypothetical protein